MTVELSDWSMTTRQQSRVPAALTPLLGEFYGADPESVNVRFHPYPPTDFAVGGIALSRRLPRVARVAKPLFG